MLHSFFLNSYFSFSPITKLYPSVIYFFYLLAFTGSDLKLGVLSYDLHTVEFALRRCTGVQSYEFGRCV